MLQNRAIKSLASLVIGCILGLAVGLSACSLEAPKSNNGIKIVIDDPHKNAALAAPMLNSFESLMFSPHILAVGPSSTADFTCFAVNVTGAGISPNSAQLQGCTSSTNMHGTGVGSVSNTTARGTPVSLAVPSGPSRTIDVYGVFPPDQQNCGGAAQGSSGGGGGGGYFLGRTVSDLAADTTVTVGIAYGGAAPDVVCTGGNGSGQGLQVNSPFPGGGINTGGFNVTVNGSGFLATAIVKINGVVCSSQTFFSSNRIDCVTPNNSGTTGNVVLSVDNQDGKPAASINFFNLSSSGVANVSVNINTSGVDLGHVAVGSHVDSTFTFQNEGNVSANVVSAEPMSAPFSTFSTGSCSFSGTLAQHASCTMTVRFAPSGSGSFDTSSVNYFTSGGPPVRFVGFNP
ncbi:MAG: IPT/TIG domain-containing protein [Deltaproteobacteria bacterium]|nr:IPT/TIG domain-containing protein [Deltaproteobacteria bacterium]